MGMTARGKRRLLVLAVIGALGAAGLLAAVAVREQIRSRMVEESLVEGMAAYDAGDYSQTMSRLGYYVSRTGAGAPERGEAFFRLADARRRVPMENRRHIGTAAQLARSAVEEDPADIRARALLVEMYAQLGFVSETLEAADALLVLDPGHAEAMWTRVRMLTALGRHAQALEAAEAMARVHAKDPRPRQAAVELLVALGTPLAEIREYAAARAEESGADAVSLLVLARVQAMSGDMPAAAGTLMDVREQPIEDAATLQDLVRLLDAVGAPQEADSVLARQRAGGDLAAVAALIEVERRWKIGDTAGAKEAVDTLLASTDEPSDAALGWAMILTPGEAGEPHKRRLLERTGEEAAFWLHLVEARDAVLAAQWATALRELKLLDTRAPIARRDLVYYWMGVTLAAMGEHTNAAHALQDAVRIDPNWEFARARLISQLLLLDRVEEAVLRAAPLGRPRTSEGAFAVAKAVAAAIERGGVGTFGVGEGLTSLRELTRRSPESGDFSALLIRALLATGRDDEASQEIARLVDDALAISPASLRELMESLRGKEIAGEERLGAMAASDHADDPDVLYLVATEAAQAGRADEGKSRFREAISGAAGERRLALQRAQARFLLDIGAPEALDTIKKLAEDNPDSAQVLQDLLNADAAWADRTLVTEAVTKLRGLVGDEGAAWRIYEARRLLTFGADAASASEAMLILDRLARAEPPMVAALILAGEAMLLLDDRDGAIRYFSRAVEAEPRRAGLYPRLIALLQRSGRQVEAERRLRDFMELRDLSIGERRRRAELMVAQGMWAAALPELREIARDGTVSDMVLLALAHQRRGDHTTAESVFDRIIASGRADAQAVVSAADFHAARGRFERGLEVLDSLPSDTPATQRALLVSGFYERHGRIDDAESAFARAADESDAAEVWGELSRFYLRQGRMDEARDAIDRGLRRHPGNEQLLSMRRLDEISGSGRISSAEMRQIVSGLGAGEDSPALTMLLEALQYAQSNPTDHSGSLRRFRSVVDRHPTFFPGWSLLGGALLQTQAPDRAAEMVRVARTAMETMPNEPRAAALAYELLLEAGRFEEASAAAREWRDRTTGDVFNAELALATTELQLGRHGAAMSVLERWVPRITAEAQRNPRNVELLAFVYAASGREREAHDLLWPRAESSRDWAIVYLNAARLLQAPPKVVDEWVGRLWGVLTDPSDRLQVLNFALDGAVAGGDRDRLRRTAAMADELGSDARVRDTARLMRAVALEQAGDGREAEAAYRAVIASQSNNAMALNNLAYLLLRRGSAEEAVTLAERAVTAGGSMGATERAMMMDTLGEALLHTARVELAERTFRAAIDLAPSTARLHIGLGEALVAQGRIEEAAIAVAAAQSAGRITDDDELVGRLEALERRVREQ